MPAAIGAGRRVRVQVRFEDRCGDRHFTFIALKLGSDPAGRIEGAASRCSLEAPHDAATSPLRTTTDRDRGGGGGPACTSRPEGNPAGGSACPPGGRNRVGAATAARPSSEELSVGKACVSPWRIRWSPSSYTK